MTIETIRTPRLCLGDSPAACLKAARRLMRDARAAADAGDWRTAGSLESEACSTGAYLLTRDSPTDAYCASLSGFDGSVRKKWRKWTLERMSLPELEAAESRAEYRGGDVDKALKARREGAAMIEDFNRESAA